MNALLSPRVPLVPFDQARVVNASVSAVESLAPLFGHVLLREPPPTDAARWHSHVLAGRALRFAQPLTFTPYAATRPCSARCAFCSENLRDDTSAVPAATLRPGARYFEHLRAALASLRGVPLSYSLSGLENTDDVDWFTTLLRTLREADDGPRVEGAVLYTNGAGFAREADRLVAALQDFGVDWLEWSRHHDNAQANQRLMRFRDDEAIADGVVFEQALRHTAARLPVKLVCIVQRDGVVMPQDVLRYVRHARELGAAGVIFREFSALTDTWRRNATRRHIDAQRVPVAGLLADCLRTPALAALLEPTALTGGYYFWNARLRTDDGFEVVFEASDYGALREHEDSGRVYKLVFHANASLCAGWQPDRHVLWTPDDLR